MAEVHRVFLSPGLFGFGKLAGYDYFQHLEEALQRHFRARGRDVRLYVASTLPTASIRRRAGHLALLVDREASEDDGPIHLIGHSTGGLDVSLVMDAAPRLRVPEAALRWKPRVRSVVTINTPHYGTPLAAFFTTVSGVRLLYALCLLTVTTLSIGSPGLSAFSKLIALIGSVDELVGMDSRLLDRTTDMVLRFLDETGRDEVHRFMNGIRLDQGGIVQVMPESMDMFNAAVNGSVVTAAPRPGAIRLARRIRSPYSAFSAGVFATLHRLTARADARYPYPRLDTETDGRLALSLKRPPDDEMSDGVVPTKSMIWGEILWSGVADHLDVVGHFCDDRSPVCHVDWLNSGSHFARPGFDDMTRAITEFLLRE